MRRFGHWMEEVIAEAQANGDFDNLPGKGKPLNLDGSDPYAGAEAEAYKYLKNAGFVPEWMQLRKQITAVVVWLREHPEHPEHPSRIVLVNQLIKEHNRLIPSPALCFPQVPKHYGR